MALTQFLNQAQVNNQSAYNYYPVHSFGRLTDRNNRIVRDDVIPFMAKQLSDAVKAEDSHKTLVFIRALGNLGHPKILSAFEPYLEGQKQVSDFQRTAIVAAMDQLAVNFPRLARSVLYKIYQNAGEVHQVRAAAVFALMRTTPPVAMLQRMAEMTHHDPSNQVSAAVKSAIESAAQLQNHDQHILAANAKAAAKFLPQDSIAAEASAGSRSYLRDYIDRELDLEYAHQWSILGSQDSDYPHGIFFAARRSFGGLNRASFANAMVSSIDVLADQLADQMDDSKLNRKPQVPRNAANKNERSSKNQRNKQQNQDAWSTQKIAQLLNIETEEAEQLEAQIYSNIMGSPRFFTFDNQTIQELPEHVRKYAKELRSGRTFNYTKLYNREAVTISFPLATGFPFVYSFKTPALVQWGGEARMRTQPDMSEGPQNGGATRPEDDQVQIPKSANISAEMEMVYSQMTSAKVGFITPFDHKRYSAGYVQKSQVFLPIRIEADIDLRNQEIVAEFSPLIQSSWNNKQKQAVKIAHMSNWPYTSVQDILVLRPIAGDKDTKIVHTQQSKNVDETFGDRATGMAFQLQGKYEKRFLDFATLSKYMKRGDLPAAMLAPLAAPFPEQFNFELSFDNQKSEVKKARVTLSYANDQEDDGSQPQSAGRSHPRASRNENNNAQEANPTSKSANSFKRQQEFLQNAAAGIVHSEAAVVDMSIQFEGPAKQNHAEFIATLAFASSPIDEKSRVLVYASSSPAKSQSKQQLCFAAEAKFPSASQMNYRNAAEEKADSQIDLQVAAGDDCSSSSATKFSVKAKMQQSDQYKEALRTHPVAKQCLKQMAEGNHQLPACQKAIRYANVLNQYKVTIDYENLSSKAKNATEKLFNIARVAGYAYLDEDRMHTSDKKNRVQLEANFEMHGANVTIEAPNMRAQFKNLRLNQKMTHIAAITPDQTLVQRLKNTLKKGTGKSYIVEGIPPHSLICILYFRHLRCG